MAHSKRLRKAEKSAGTSIATEDRSPRVPQRDKIDFTLQIRERNDLTVRQQVILEAMTHKDTRAVFIDGIYGSTKTWLAVLAALRLLDTHRVDQILYIRNPIESSTSGKLGFIPGTGQEKMAPFAAPFYDKLDELLSAGDLTRLTKDGRLEVIPLGYTRGRSWNCKAIIVDEASSMSYDDLMLILTRCGEFTRVFFVGDTLNQNDIGAKAGMRRMYDAFNDDESAENGVHTFELRQSADILRSRFLQFAMRKLGVIKDDPVDGLVNAEPMFPAHDPLRQRKS